MQQASEAWENTKGRAQSRYQALCLYHLDSSSFTVTLESKYFSHFADKDTKAHRWGDLPTVTQLVFGILCLTALGLMEDATWGSGHVCF